MHRLYPVALGYHHSCNDCLHCKPEKICEVCIPGDLRAGVFKSRGGRGTALFWLYQDVPLDRVWVFGLAVLKVTRNSFHLPQTSFTNSFPITVWFIVSV